MHLNAIRKASLHVHPCPWLYASRLCICEVQYRDCSPPSSCHVILLRMLRFIAFELSRMIRMIRKLRAAHLSRAALHRATLLSMADQARSLHAEDREVAGDDNAHLTKKRCLALEHENGSHGHGAESDQANHSTEAATQYDNMTETAQAGFYMLETRVGVADSKIDELTQAGELLLDRLKAEFISKMQEYKQYVHTYAETEAQKWAEQSTATQQACERLHTAKQLVSTLGLSVESNLTD